MKLLASRRHRTTVKVLVCLSVLAGSPAFGFEPALNASEVVQQALRAAVEDQARSREYALTQESIEREVGKDGKVVEVKRKTYDVMPVGGQPYQFLTRRDGQPLSGEDARKEQSKYEDVVRKRASESAEQRKRRIADFEEKASRRQEMFVEIPKAFTFFMAGEGEIDAEPVWIIDMKPKPGYRPPSARARFLAHMNGRLYVSKQQKRMMKADVVTTEPVSLGWFLAKLAPGTRILIEQMRLPDGIWVMKRFKMNYDVKVALFKQVRGEAEQLMWDYRRPAAVARR